MSTSKSSIVEKSIKHSVSPIRDVLVVPPGAVQTREENAESIHTHPALLVEQRIISEVKPKSISTTPSSRTTNTGNNIATPIKEHELPKKTVSPKTKKEGKRRVKRRGNRKRTRHAGGGSGTRKKYNRKLRTTRGRKRR